MIGIIDARALGGGGGGGGQGDEGQKRIAGNDIIDSRS